jgi:hypothetical protein
MYKLSQQLNQLGKYFVCPLCTIHKYDVYTILLKGYWKSYVHMMCLIPMLNFPHF